MDVSRVQYRWAELTLLEFGVITDFDDCAAWASISDLSVRLFWTPQSILDPAMRITPRFLAITISTCAGLFMAPLHAESSEGSSEDSSSEPTPPLPSCLARWYTDSHVTKQEWLQRCDSAAADEPNYNVDYARCIADWDPETHMTKREWHRSCTDVVKEDPGAFEAIPLNR